MRRQLSTQRSGVARTAVLAGLVLVLAACGDSAVTGVVHLDPRLADGSSPAEVLAVRRVVVRRWTGDRDLAPWVVRGAAVAAGEDGRCRVLTPAGGEVLALELESPIQAASQDVLEVDALLPVAGAVTVRWRGLDDPDGSWPPGQVVRHEVEASPDPQRVRLLLTPQRAWSGEIAALRVELPAAADAVLCLYSLRLVRLGFVPGPGYDPALEGHGGAVELDRTAVLAWPTEWGHPLQVRAEVPPGGRLEVAVARLDEGVDPVMFAIVVRLRDGTVATALSELVRTSRAWKPLVADLSAWAGETVDIGFVAAPDDRLDEGNMLPLEATHLWGAPILYGTELPEPRRDIVLITLDTARADALSIYGGPAPTPFLDRFVRDAVVFEDAWSTTNATQPSHASILTGEHVQDHGVVDNTAILGPDSTTLAERLRAAGWQTVGAVSQQNLGTRGGFGQGFDIFLEAHHTGHLDGSLALLGVDGFLSDWSSRGRRPLFLWVHLFDPHTPYTPPDKWLAPRRAGAPGRTAEPATMPILDVVPPEMRFLEGVTSLEHVRWMYGSGITYTDALLEYLSRQLAGIGIWDEAIVCIAGDHGESLGERGVWFGHVGLTPEVLRVPLVLRVPGWRPKGRVSDPVSTLDVAPTLLGLAGLPAQSADRGLDLVGLVEGGGDRGRTRFFEHSDGHQVGVRDGRWHLTRTLGPNFARGMVPVRGEDGLVRMTPQLDEEGAIRLYDVEVDAALAKDIAGEHPDATGELLRRVEQWRAGARARGTVRRSLTAGEVAAMAAMGYTYGQR